MDDDSKRENLAKWESCRCHDHDWAGAAGGACDYNYNALVLNQFPLDKILLFTFYTHKN